MSQTTMFEGKKIKFDGALLYQIRKALKLNQSEVAKQIGVAQKSVSFWELGGKAERRNRQRVAEWCAANLHALREAETGKRNRTYIVSREHDFPLRFCGTRLAQTLDGSFHVYKTAGGTIICDGMGLVAVGTDAQKVFAEVMKWNPGRRDPMRRLLMTLNLQIFEEIE